MVKKLVEQRHCKLLEKHPIHPDSRIQSQFRYYLPEDERRN
jgi:hypothetical protein